MSDHKIPNGKQTEVGCPRCGAATLLVVRTNRQQGNQFLGCPNWPKCGHTQPIPEHIRMEAAGQPRLF